MRREHRCEEIIIILRVPEYFPLFSLLFLISWAFIVTLFLYCSFTGLIRAWLLSFCDVILLCDFSKASCHLFWWRGAVHFKNVSWAIKNNFFTNLFLLLSHPSHIILRVRWRMNLNNELYEHGEEFYDQCEKECLQQ